jgi:hypothetical protein
MFQITSALGYSCTGSLWSRAVSLERGRFAMPREVPAGTTHVVIEASGLVLLLEGIDLRDAHRRPRWQPPAGADAPTMS